MPFKSFLSSSSPPYILTIFFALVGWCINGLATSYEQSPAIEFHVSYNDQKKQILIDLYNMSTGQGFSDLTLLAYPQDKSILQEDASYATILFPPNHIYGIRPTPEVNKDKTYIKFPIKVLHPSSRATLEIPSGTRTDITLFAACDTPVRLVQSSFISYVMKNKENAFVILLLTLSCVIMAYLLFLPTEKE